MSFRGKDGKRYAGWQKPVSPPSADSRPPGPGASATTRLPYFDGAVHYEADVRTEPFAGSFLWRVQVYRVEGDERQAIPMGSGGGYYLSRDAALRAAGKAARVHREFGGRDGTVRLDA